MNFNNFVLNTDSYKLSHYKGYPADATNIYSYAESRGGEYPDTVFLGLQVFARQLADVHVTATDVYEAEEFARMHGVPFNFDGWMRIVYVHAGRIPVRIKAVAEGSLVPTHNVLVTVENTDPTMPWLTSYIETALLRAVWYPTTVATRVHSMKQIIKPYFDATSDKPDMGFGILDFSARGVSSRETAAIGGLGHLVNFIGSDNIPAILAAKDYYDEPMAAFSVAATEHSIMTSFGKDNELDSFKYLIENMMPTNGILSVVSDTWNVYEAVDKFASLQYMIENKGGTLVIRPDSGNMSEVLPHIFSKIKDKFAGSYNKKGYFVPNRVKVLQGDGIKEDTVHLPFAIGKDARLSADAIMSGSGGGLLQSDIDRDTLKFAFKASNVKRDGVDYPIAKNPITDKGKQSKAGRLELHLQNGHYNTLTPGMARNIANKDQLQLVYENGKLFNQQTFAQIRARLAKQ